MKRKYKLHPGLYEIGENEKFYSDMEAKGWRLGKRGAHFSWFLPVEPSQARYRIEVFSPGFLEQSVMPEEQLAVFADCGWEYVTDWGVLHIFRAPAGSDAPEFYADPAQQAETLKRMKRDAVWGWIPQLAVWAIYFLLFFTLNGASRFGGEFRKGLADALMNTSTFGSGGEHFEPLHAEGLDAAWANPRMEIVAVKGDLVAYITYLAGSSRDFDPQTICQVLAEKWAD